MTPLDMVTLELEGALRQRPDTSLSEPLLGPLEDVERLMRQAVRGDTLEILGDICTEHLDTGGKRVRARLALAAAEAVGVSRALAAPWAAAVETLHNATLIHDDVQDGDTVRRGRPTTWAAHGMPQAINAGDLMLMLPVSRLVGQCSMDDGVRWRMSHALLSCAEAVVRGQAADISLRARIGAESVDPVDAYMRCIEGKTGALFALPVEGAALLAGRSEETARRLAEPFLILGLLFQLQDDVLDLYGHKGREQIGSDVKEGKISALVVEHLRLRPEDRPWLLRILDAPRERTTDAEVQEVIGRFAHGGTSSALEATLRRIARLASSAHASPALDDEPRLRALVLDVVAQVLGPIHHLFARESP